MEFFGEMMGRCFFMKEPINLKIIISNKMGVEGDGAGCPPLLLAEAVAWQDYDRIAKQFLFTSEVNVMISSVLKRCFELNSMNMANFYKNIYK